MKTSLLTLFAAILLLNPTPVSANTCKTDPGNMLASGDYFAGDLWGYNKKIAKSYARIFSMHKADWSGGFGYSIPWDLTRPTGRTINALAVLQFSPKDYAKKRADYNGSILRWGFNYSATVLDELDARCGKSETINATTRTGYFVDHWTQLYKPFFYYKNAIQRASIIIHEARHAQGYMHTGGSRCDRNVSCDSSWGGANSYQVSWLAYYNKEAFRSTVALRESAADSADVILDQGFWPKPNWRIKNL